MKDNEVKLPQLTAVYTINNCRTSEPGLQAAQLQMCPFNSSLFLKMLFSFSNFLIKYEDRHSLKAALQSIGTLPNQFFFSAIFYLMHIYEIFKPEFQQVRGHFKQMPFKMAHLVSTRQCPALLICQAYDMGPACTETPAWSLQQVEATEGRATGGSSAGIGQPRVQSQADSTHLCCLENHPASLTCSSPLGRIRAALTRSIDKAVTFSGQLQGKHCPPLGAVVSEARLSIVRMLCLREGRAHFVLNIDAPIPASRMNFSAFCLQPSKGK